VVPPAALTNANTATARYHAIVGLASDVCNIRAFELMRFITPPPIEKRSNVMTVSVCLSLCVFVCPRSYLRNGTSYLHQFSAHYIRPWLGPPLAA